MQNRRDWLLSSLAASASAAIPHKEIRLIAAAPSPYTRRRDSYRVGAGILLCLRRLIEEHRLPLQATYYDSAPLTTKTEQLRRLFRDAPVLLVGTSVWAQGPASVGRAILESVNGEDLSGVQASTWVCSGGVHTGGALAYESNLATLRSMGASVFSYGQKQAVFSTDERMGPEKAGEFTLLDFYFMEGLAKASVVAALGSGERSRSRDLWKQLGSAANYYHGYFPTSEKLLAERFGEYRSLINAALNPSSKARLQIDGLLSQL